MMDPNGLTLLMHLHRDELLREASAQWLVDEALASQPSRTMPRTARWRQMAEPSFVAAIIEHLRQVARLESTSG